MATWLRTCVFLVLLALHWIALYVQAVRLEQGPGVIENPPVYPVPAKEFGAFSVTKPYCLAIAKSEPTLTIEGNGYWYAT